MKFGCPHCQQHLDADASWAGRDLDCPGCGKSFTVPSNPPDISTTPLTSSSTTPASDPRSIATPASRNHRKLSIALAVLAVITIGAYLRFNPGSIPAALTGLHVQELRILPPQIQLKSRGDVQSVVVQAILEDGSTRDVTSKASIQVQNRSLAEWKNHRLTPLHDGSTMVSASLSGKSAEAKIEVTDASKERPVSFRLDVMPVLMKAGCNSGNCHGASRGKEGFHLSLFGYDPDGDHRSLTQEQIGRRINPAFPEESLILQKGLASVAHGGGERFKTSSTSYQTLLQWLKAGALDDGTNSPTVVSLQIFPTEAVMEGAGTSQQLTALARYSDGTDRDVTTLAVFFSNNEVTAKVSEEGLITAGQRGEAFVMARFATHTVGCQVIVVPSGSKPLEPVQVTHYIDEKIQTKLRKLRMNPSPLCDDATFIRRVYLDITGTLPSSEQVTDFVSGMSTGKREQLVDELLQRKEFAELWVMKFAELLQIRSFQDQFSYKAALQYYDWLRGELARNVPIDRIVQQLLTGSGSTFQHPVANYYQVQTDTLKIAENTAQVFMGMRIQCAQCHNHPFDRWTMNDYYGFASFFGRIGRKPGEDPRESIVFDRPEGEVKHPVGGRVMAPKFLGGEQPLIPAGMSRRESLAQWMTSAENPYFAKNMANLVWAHFMGRGIIEPVDDVRVSNPASNPELLDALATRFAEYHFDFRKLVRDICTSQAYQRSTRPNETNAHDDRNFARAQIRRLRAEVLLDVISQVTDTKDKFQGLPKGARAVEIPDGNVNNYFLRTFGRATRNTVCSCEVRTEPNLSQALHLLNGNTVQDKLDQSGLITRWIKEGKKTDAILEELYLRCLARTPTPEEREKLGAFIKDSKDPSPILQDIFWSLLNSKEFVFNH